MKEIIPVNGKVLVKPETAEKMKGSIIIPDTIYEKEKPVEGVILRVSEDIESSGNCFKPGDKVVFIKQNFPSYFNLLNSIFAESGC